MHAATSLPIASPAATLRNILGMSASWVAALCLTWRAELLTTSLAQALALLLASSLVVVALGMAANALRSQPVVLQALGCGWHEPLRNLLLSKLILASVVGLEVLFALSMAQLLKRLLS